MLRHDRQQRFGNGPKQLVHPHERIGGGRAAVAEPPHDRIAALGIFEAAGHIAKPLESKPPEHGQHIIIQPERRHRQGGKACDSVIVAGQDR